MTDYNYIKKIIIKLFIYVHLIIWSMKENSKPLT